MRKFALLSAALAIVLACASVASATSLVKSLYNVKIYDRSNIFSNLNPATPALEPEPIGAPVDPGDEQRNIFTVTSMEYQGTKADIGSPGDISGGGPYPGFSGSGTLTGMLYDLKFRATESGAPSYLGGSDSLYFDAGGRYVAGVDWVDTVIGAVDAATVPGAGALLVVYEDLVNPPIFATGLDTISPATWTEKSTPTASPAIPGGLLDGILPISDVEPWLIAVLMPNPLIAGVAALPTDLVQETFFVFPGGQFLGFGTAFANVIGGTITSTTMFQQDLFGPGLDIKLSFSLSNPSAGSLWQLNSSDPVMFGVIPEPATISLLGLGIAGLGLLRRRQSK